MTNYYKEFQASIATGIVNNTVDWEEVATEKAVKDIAYQMYKDGLFKVELKNRTNATDTFKVSLSVPDSSNETKEVV